MSLYVVYRETKLKLKYFFFISGTCELFSAQFGSFYMMHMLLKNKQTKQHGAFHTVCSWIRLLSGQNPL